MMPSDVERSDAQATQAEAAEAAEPFGGSRTNKIVKAFMKAKMA